MDLRTEESGFTTSFSLRGSYGQKAERESHLDGADGWSRAWPARRDFSWCSVLAQQQAAGSASPCPSTGCPPRPARPTAHEEASCRHAKRV